MNIIDEFRRLEAIENLDDTGLTRRETLALAIMALPARDTGQAALKARLLVQRIEGIEDGMGRIEAQICAWCLLDLAGQPNQP